MVLRPTLFNVLNANATPSFSRGRNSPYFNAKEIAHCILRGSDTLYSAGRAATSNSLSHVLSFFLAGKMQIGAHA
jgi:hypothetical protein